MGALTVGLSLFKARQNKFCQNERINDVNTFKFVCYTKFGCLQLVISFFELFDLTDLQKLNDVCCREFHIDLNGEDILKCTDENNNDTELSFSDVSGILSSIEKSDHSEIDTSGNIHSQDNSNTYDSFSNSDIIGSINENSDQSEIDTSDTIQYSQDNLSMNSDTTLQFSDGSFGAEQDNIRLSINSSSEKTFEYDIPQEGTLRIYYTNADNLMNKRTELQAYIEICKADVVIVTETFPKNMDSTHIKNVEMKLEGYTYFHGRTSEKSRGVCIYCKESLSAQDCKILNDDVYEESCWCEIKLHNSEKLLIGGIYRSPSCSVNNTYKLNDLIGLEISMQYNYTVVARDFNFPSINWDDWTTTESDNHSSFKFIECLRDNYLTQFINKPTRYRDGQTSNTLDLFITDRSEIVQNVSYGSSLGASDHISFTVDLLCTLNNVESATVKRNYYKGDYSAARDYLSGVDWSEMDSMNVQESWGLFIGHVTNCVDKFIPVKKQCQKKMKPKWMDRYCLECVKQKSKTWNKYLRTRNQIDYMNFCAARNKATKATIYAKRKYERSIAQNIKDNPKTFWSYVRSKTKSRTGIADLKGENGQMLSTDIDKANALNDFFASVFTNEDTQQVPFFDLRYHGTPITEVITSRDKILKELKNLNISKSMGPDGCHPRFLKETSSVICEPLETIFNKSYYSGEVPKIWKDAYVSSIYKNKGDKSECGNYRPVSLTCIPCRISEKFVREVMMDHMNSNKLFSNCQFGFRSKRSCILQLLDVYDDWVKAYDEGYQIDTIYLDFKKAFDSVPHERLLIKLKGYTSEMDKRLFIRTSTASYSKRSRI